MRASSYNIYVDLPDNPEEMLLVQGYTGAYDKVSRRVATYVRSLESGRPPKPLYGSWSPEPAIDGQVLPPSEQTISILKRRGYLTDLSVEEEETFFSKIAQSLHTRSRTPAFIFMPTYDCNLRCSYCFQDHMRMNPEFKHLLRTMRRSMVDRVFAAIPKIEEHHGLPADPLRTRNIGFFGGEPLLEGSRRIVEYIITTAKSLGPATFWAVTNGTDLHAYRDLLGPGLLGMLQITLDGPSSEHDKRRIYADGSGSFERIARNITMALELGVEISVRMNIDRNNIGMLPELADEIIARGWHTHPSFGAYTAPIHASNDHTDIKTTFSSWELNQALTALREEHPSMKVIGRPDDRITNKAFMLFHKHDAPTMQATFCGAHNGMYVIDIFGDLFACWERTGDPNIRIGRVTEDGGFELEDQQNKLWRSRNVTTNAICRKCRYALHCGGGCAVLAEGHRGEFFTNFCDGFAARFRNSVAEAYLEYVAGSVAITKAERVCDM